MAETKVTTNEMKFTEGTGYLYIGSVLIQWGSVTTAQVGTGAYAEVNTWVTFPKAFSSTPAFVVTPSDFNNACGEYASYSNLSTTGVTVWCGHSATSTAATNTLKWIAIGQ